MRDYYSEGPATVTGAARRLVAQRGILSRGTEPGGVSGMLNRRGEVLGCLATASEGFAWAMEASLAYLL